MKRNAQLTVSELAQVVGQSTIPATVAARFSLILSILSFVVAAIALAVAVSK